MPFILGANSVSGYTVKNSLRFNRSSSDQLTRSIGTTGNRKTATYSCWIKKCDFTNEQMFLGFTSGLNIYTNGDSFRINSGGGSYAYSTALQRDPSAWYHFLIGIDTTQATSTNRFRLYINGTELTSFSLSSYPTQNSDLNINVSGSTQQIGSDGTSHINGYMSELYWIDGTQLTPTSFGETDTDTGIWKPKAYTGTYGTNGFYLKFANSASLGTDSSGNANTFTVNNLTSVDQSTDTPTNNFCTLNPLASGVAIGGAGGTFTEGNTIFTGTGANWCASKGTFSVTAGKWYFEAKKITNANGTTNGSGAVGIGYAELQNNLPNDNPQNGASIYGNILMLNDNGWTTNFANGTQWSTAYNVANGDIAGVALDLDTNTYNFYINGVSKNSGSLGGGYDGLGLTPCIVQYGGDTRNFYFNFGNPSYTGGSYTDGAGYGNFSYSVPSGFYSLNTKNLATYG